MQNIFKPPLKAEKIEMFYYTPPPVFINKYSLMNINQLQPKNL